MTDRRTMAQSWALEDAASLRDVVRYIRRRKIDPDGMTRAALCRLLLAEADRCSVEARGDPE